VSERAPVNRILRSSIVDGPGNRAAVFLQGCNFDCVYCHNPETIALCNSCGRCLAVCPAGALSENAGGVLWEKERCLFCDACIRTCPRNSSPRTRFLTAEETIAEIDPVLPFIRGLTVSGGECTLYPAFLQELGALAKERGLSFFLDTNGSYDFSGNTGLLEITDGVMLDVKADPDNTEYKKVTGRNGYDTLGFGEFLARKGKLFEFRTVVSPGLFNAAALVDKACRRIKGVDPRIQYKLIRYRPVGVRPDKAAKLAVPGDSLMEELAGICESCGIKAVIV
jgi:pyruvate formate lyase activating enzyme